MMRHLLCLLLLLATTPLTATTSEKEAIARGVFERLVAARGDHSVPDPHFVLTTGKRSGARCEGNLIILEEAAYDLCVEFGEDRDAALAGVLAHELIHYYAGHVYGKEALALITTGDSGSDFAANEGPLTAQESEADYRGGFLAYLAGYPLANLVPRFLDRLYETYALPQRLAGYPDLDERKALAERNHERLRELVAVFEMANVLTALERFGEAATYYEHLLRAFPSREMHNNAGVVYARAALPFFPPTTLQYVYPIELDLRSRLEGQTRGIGVDPATRNFYLEEARKHFVRAHLLDPDYVPALINLASTHALLAASLTEGGVDSLTRAIAADHHLEAALRAREAIRLADGTGDPVSAVNAHLLLGILAALDSEETRVFEHFARAESSPLYSANWSVFRHGRLPPAPPAPASPPFVMQEQIGDRTLAELRSAPPASTSLLGSGSGRMKLSRLQISDPGVILMRHSGGMGSDLTVAHLTREYSGASAMEISVGSTHKDILREYGAPAYGVTTLGGELLVYPESGIIFSLGGGAVSGWYLY
jgi:tetratricopeptide (TPR) repeat protein